MLPHNIDLNVLLFGFLAGCLSIFVNYIIGKPGSEFSPYEIFSRYTIYLSKKRLKDVGLFFTYHNQFWDSMKQARTRIEQRTLWIDYKKLLYQSAEPFFTWERAVGMCSICTGFWISVISGLFYTFNISEIIEIIITSHVTIRILNKIL